MRKYYLFIIKKEYYEKYKRSSYVLYRIIENLYRLKTYDFSYGINIYKELCLPFPIKLFNNYINQKIDYKRINSKIIKIESSFEETYIEVNRSVVIIKSSVNFPMIFRIFNIYNKNIFVCDFENKDFFWLSKQIKISNFLD